MDGGFGASFYLVEETDDVAVIVKDDWGGGQGALDADGEAAG